MKTHYRMRRRPWLLDLALAVLGFFLASIVASIVTLVFFGVQL
jgi:hypothetical protein